MLNTLFRPLRSNMWKRASRGAGGEADLIRLPPSIEKWRATVLRCAALPEPERSAADRELRRLLAEALASGRLPMRSDETQAVAALPAARLIGQVVRREQRRRRRERRRICSCVWAACRLILLAYGIYFTSCLVTSIVREPLVTRDYLAETQAPILAIPDDDRAWPLYREVIADVQRTSPEPESRISDRPPRPGDEYYDMAIEAWALAREWIPQISPQIARLREASRRPSLGHVPDVRPSPEDLALLTPREAKHAQQVSMSGMPMLAAVLNSNGGSPPLRPLSDASRWMQAHAWLVAERAAAGEPIDDLILSNTNADAGTATSGAAPTALDHAQSPGRIIVEDVAALVRLSSHLKQHPIVLTQLVGLGMQEEVCTMVGGILEVHADLLSDQDLVDLMRIMRSITDDQLKLRNDSDGLALADYLQHIYSDDGDGNGRVTTTGMVTLAQSADPSLSGPPRASGYAVLAVLTALRTPFEVDRATIARIEAEQRAWEHGMMSRPFWTWREADLDPRSTLRVADDSTAVGMITSHLRPITNAAAVMWNGDTSPKWIALIHRVRMDRDLALTAIAMERYHRALGGGPDDWPESLAALQPAYLTTLPRDHRTGAVLFYQRDDAGRPMIYASGEDLDDDGGIEMNRINTDIGLFSHLMTPEMVTRHLAELEAARDPVTGEIPPQAVEAIGTIQDGDEILFYPGGNRLERKRERPDPVEDQRRGRLPKPYSER